MFDLAYSPDGTLYGLLVGVNLVEIQLTNPPNVVNLGVDILSSTFFSFNAMICSADNILYLADSHPSNGTLLAYDLNDGSLSNLGTMNFASAGDLAYNGGDLYLASLQGDLIAVDLENPAESELVTAIGENLNLQDIFGIVTTSSTCTETITYASAGNTLYAIDIETGAATESCSIDSPPGFQVFGAASDSEFNASDCALDLDLDEDDSSGLEGVDFQEEYCNPENVPIVDSDLILQSTVGIDSITVTLVQGELDGFEESLNLVTAGLVTIDVLSNTEYLLYNGGANSVEDFWQTLQDLQYNNIAIDPSGGLRVFEIVVTDLAGNTVTANSYLYLSFTGDPCDDEDPMTVNDVLDENCECSGEVPLDCPDLLLNIGDACDDGNPDTSGDTVQDDCTCQGQYDCPELGLNVGMACDDGNPETSNDEVQPDCTCAGLVDCPSLGLNIGSACDDGNEATENDQIDENCDCIGICVEQDCNDDDCATLDEFDFASCSCVHTFVDGCEEYFAALPSAFSPNEDGVNDVFVLRYNGITEYQLVIFNRWGEEVFKTQDPSINWDGTHQEEQVGIEVFVYVLEVVFVNGELLSETGNVTVVY